VTATTPEVNASVGLETWLIVLTVLTGTLPGGAPGMTTAMIVLVIIQAVANSLAHNQVANAVNNALVIPPAPLGPVGGGIIINDLILDDLELHCSIVKSAIPVRNSGEYSSAGAFTLDLDTGEIDSAVVPETDLVWDPARGFLTQGASGLTVTGTPFGGLTPAQISRFSLSSRLIPMSSVPFSFPFPVLSTPVREVVFGMRTTMGRYAKVRAFRDQSTSSAPLSLEWTTYETPAAELELTAHWSVAERGEVTVLVTDFEYCESSPVAWSGVFEARPKLMAFPVDYQWCLCGQILQKGKGFLRQSTGGEISYRLDGRILQIRTEKGVGIDCELCVSAIHRGLEFFRCLPLSKPGIETRCRKSPPPRNDKYRIEVIPPDPEIANWRPLNVAELLKPGK
jgi:hypothetical protein